MATPINEIIRHATIEYLDGLDPNNPPDSSTIEAELINEINLRIGTENTIRPKSEAILPIQRLGFSQIATIMLRLHHICRISPTGKNTDPDYDLLAMYVEHGENKGIYVTSEDHFRKIARNYNYAMSTKEFSEVMAAIKDGAQRKERTLNRDFIPVNNGIFDYSTKELLPFSPEYVFISKSHINYVPGAPLVTLHNDDDGTDWDVESWMATLSDDPEVVELLWEIIGATLRPNVRWNKAAFFYSTEGNNGKGTLCELMRNVLGPSAYASIPLADFSKDFLLEPLTRAQCVIVDENDVGTFLDKAANLKAVITNDVISINRKFKSPIAYQFFGFMIQCLNEFPKIRDRSESFYRRQLFVPFEKNFRGIERRYIKDDYLWRTEVLEYVLHRVLHMNYYVLSEPEATKAVLEEFKENNSPVQSFFAEFEERFSWDLLPFGFLYDLYKSWFSANHPSGSMVSRNAFINELVPVVNRSTMWYCDNHRNKVRRGKMMDGPEPLIYNYQLENWMSKVNKYGSNINLIATPDTLSQSYRGIRRYQSLGVVTDELDGDDQESQVN